MTAFHRFDPRQLPWQPAARLGPALAWGLALGASAWVAADLFWRFNAPPPPALPVSSQADPLQAAQAVAGRHLMGRDHAAPPGTNPVAPAPGRFAAHATVTGGDGRPGWAVLSVDDGPQEGIVEGQAIRPGITLTRVGADTIEISIGGVRQSVRLTERPLPEDPSPAERPQPPSRPPAALALPDAAPNDTPDSGPRSIPAGFPAQTPSPQ
ncbi:type II secretion system protein N [Zoogloea sp.]|uniref:type II secretion system protein N n=1 Tax=Zoogloea sp. TaxID=49181 RepID=UPI00261A6462|nr:type II secretion system protein N [Zoogloea sp.]MDD3353646.1 type II secretion system protein N [Zoogloea sp.]